MADLICWNWTATVRFKERGGLARMITCGRNGTGIFRSCIVVKGLALMVENAISAAISAAISEAVSAAISEAVRAVISESAIKDARDIQRNHVAVVIE